MYKIYLFYIYKKVIHIFNSLTIFKNIWVKIEVEKEMERRGDNIGLLELTEKKPKNFVFGITFLIFF